MRECVCGHVCQRTCVWVSISLANRTDVHVEMCSGSWKQALQAGGKELVRRSHFLDTLKNGSLLGYFSLTAAKSSDSNLATRLQSGNHMCTQPLSLLMSNCNRPHIRATARADHSCSSQHKYFVMNMLAKTNLLTSWTVFHAETKPHKRLQKTDTQPPLLSWEDDFSNQIKPRTLFACARFLLIIMCA